MRPSLAHLLFLAMFAFGLLQPVASGGQQASAASRAYAGIVVDAKSGKVLYESAADAARYPASVTKVMTLYVLFQELQAGNIRLSDKMTVSKHAAAAVPTKLGLSAGSKIKVEDAIKSLVTLSANDMARVIAEHISGTESKFAERMTATAHALGMRRTTYRNASGLPDSKQVTTVRDQAILGAAIHQHFPKYYEYFQTRSFSYGKRTYGNHNRLLGNNGVDGIKTGYIRASGFNLLTAARKDNRHIVVVAFGFDKAASRDSKVRELVKSYLPKARSGGYLDVAMIPSPGRKGATIQVATAPPVPAPYPAIRLAARQALQTEQAGTFRPDPSAVAAQLERPLIVASAPAPAVLPAAATATEAASELVGSAPRGSDDHIDVIGAWLSENLSLGAPPAPLGATRASAPLVPPVGVGDSGQAIDPLISGSVGSGAAAAASHAAPPPTLESAAMPGSWVVQIGATPTPQGASSLLNSATGTISALSEFQPYVERFEKNGQVFFRARFAGFGGRDDAASMCNRLKQVKLSCLAMQS